MKGFWREDDDYGKLEPLTDEVIAIAEKQLKVKLPDSYINILQEQNGGYINFNAYPTTVPTSWAEDYIHVELIFGIGKEKGILESEYLIQEWGLPRNVVLIAGDGHSWIAFDYRKQKTEPPVILLDVDEEKIIELAPNFETFLNGLYIQSEELNQDYSDDDIQRQWTITEMDEAFAAHDELEIGHALDYLLLQATKDKEYIEQSFIKLLQHPKLEVKETAANYANHFFQEGILSEKFVKRIVEIIRNDNEIEYYADMFFEGM